MTHVSSSNPDSDHTPRPHTAVDVNRLIMATMACGRGKDMYFGSIKCLSLSQPYCYIEC